MGFKSLEEIVALSLRKDLEFWEIIQQEDVNERSVSTKDSFEKMKLLYDSMKHADSHYDGTLKSASGLVGGDGEKMQNALDEKKLIGGDFINEVITKALKMNESNACMKKIVAAPTAGSCGVLPAVLLTYEETYGEKEEQMVKALYVASGVGQVIAARASLSGAIGGCQAEIGSASAMAAAALTFLMGGNNQAIIHAAGIALKNLLGLVCDPVAGLVEVPCVKRNVVGAMNAIASANMGIAGIVSQIPPDEVVDAMRSIGEAMHSSLRETGEGGLAGTKTGQELMANIMAE